MNDWTLLREYVERTDEQSFRTVVQRHIDMVYSAALRQVRQPQLAEDVTQGVFMLLARKAASLSSGIVVGGWLYRTASLMAMRAHRDQLRRQRLEVEAATMSESHMETTADLWAKIEPNLDAALAALHETDRNAVVLRYLEQRPFHEVAEALGVSEEAAKKRVSRAVDKLRGMLDGHGTVVPLSALGLVLSTHALRAAPKELADQVMTAAVSGGAAGSAVATALVAGAARSTLLRQLRLPVFLAATVLLFVGARQVWSHFGDTKPAPTPQMTTAAAAPQLNRRASVAAGAFGSPAAATADPLGMKVTLLMQESDTPLGGARVKAVFYGSPSITVNAISDTHGVVSIRRPAREFRGFTYWVGAENRVPLVVRFERSEELSLPPDYTVRLARGRRIEGRVVDEEGRGIPSVMLHFQGEGIQWNSRESVDYRAAIQEPVTDLNGKWVADFIRPSDEGLYGHLSHSGYAATSFNVSLTGNSNIVLTINRGRAISGRVVNEDGDAIPDARLVLRDTSGWTDSQETRSDSIGNYMLLHVGNGRYGLVVTAESHASENRVLDLANGAPTNVNFKMRTVHPVIAGNEILRGRVVDEDGKPGTGVGVVLAYRQPGLEGVSWSSTTDSGGRFHWTNAPARPVRLQFSGWDWAQTVAELTPGEEEHLVTVKHRAKLIVRGVVTDDALGTPIERFKVIGGGAPRGKQLLGSPSMVGEGRDGNFQLSIPAEQQDRWRRNIAEDASNGIRLMFVAEGYVPEIVVLGETNIVDLQVSLQRSVDVTATVTFRNGDAASGAQAALQGSQAALGLIEPGKFQDYGDLKQYKATTDTNGTFTLRRLPGTDRVVVIHPEGWASVPIPRSPATRILLQPWGRIEGSVRIGGRVPEHVRVFAMSPKEAPEQIGFSYYADVEPSGYFVLAKVPPGRVQIGLVTQGEKVGVFSHSQWVEVRAGETTKAIVGGAGTRLVGRIVASKDGANVSWRKSTQHLNVKKRTENAKIDFSYGFFCREDGSFALDDVAAGDYTLNAQLVAPEDRVDSANNVMARILGTSRREVSVPAASGGEVNVGEILVEIK